MEQGGKYIAMMILRSNGEDIGFLGVAYNNEEAIKPKEEIKKVLDEQGKHINDMLDLGVQRIVIYHNKKNGKKTVE